MSDDRPQRALCVLGCRALTGHPYPAVPGYLTCDRCSDRLRAVVTELPDLYGAILDTAVLLYRRQDSGRAPKGFGSRPPASDHLISMRDPRTVAVDPGDPHNALNILWWYADHTRRLQNLPTPTGPVIAATEAATLQFHWDWILRQHWVVDMARDLREVAGQLRHAIPGSEPAPKRVGTCTQPLDTTDDEGRRQVCGQSLYLPKTGATITCRACGHDYQGPDLIKLHLTQRATP